MTSCHGRGDECPDPNPAKSSDLLYFSRNARIAFMPNTSRPSDIPEPLAQALVDGNVVVVVGAGVSYTSSGHDVRALWSGFLQDGLDQCRRLGRSVQHPLARLSGPAEKPSCDEFVSLQLAIEEALGEQRNDWFVETIGKLPLVQPGLPKAIMDLGVPVMTVNYDSHLEQAGEVTWQTWRNEGAMERFGRESPRFVLHLYGHWQDPKSLVPGSLRYEQLADVPGYYEALRRLFRNRTFLFVGVGTSLVLPPFSELQIQDAGGRPHYRLGTRSMTDEWARTQFNDALRPLSFGDTFDDLEPYLNRMALWLRQATIKKEPDEGVDEGVEATVETKARGHGRAGFGAHMPRDASQTELALDVTAEAAALASVLDAYKDELCFAVLGAWGRGKTTFVRCLVDRLRTDGQRTEYGVVHFNGWKYRTPPEVWAYLYEQFVLSSRRDGSWRHTGRTLRANAARHGLWPLAVALLLLAIGIVPKSAVVGPAWEAATWMVGAVGGLGIAAWLGSAVMRTTSVFRRVWGQYGSLPSHQDKLGLQAAIGADLKAFLRGWVRQPAKEPDLNAVERELIQPNGVSQLACAFAALLPGAAVWPHSPEATATLSVAALAVIVQSWRKPKRAQRVLLVIDDLDRCQPGQMLDILESVRLLVEEPGIRERLQVIVLVDEIALGHAVEARFQHMLPKEGPERERQRVRVVREHMEKLFIGSLRLGPLTDGDVRELVSKLGQGVEPPEPKRSATPRSTQSLEPAHTVGTALSDGVTNQSFPAEQLSGSAQASLAGPEVAKSRPATERALPLSSSADAILTDDERADILARCQEIIRGGGGPRFGPRSIRSLAFRYQLARVLLRTLSPRDPIPTADMLERLGALKPPPHAQSSWERMVDKVSLTNVPEL